MFYLSLAYYAVQFIQYFMILLNMRVLLVITRFGDSNYVLEISYLLVQIFFCLAQLTIDAPNKKDEERGKPPLQLVEDPLQPCDEKIEVPKKMCYISSSKKSVPEQEKPQPRRSMNFFERLISRFHFQYMDSAATDTYLLLRLPKYHVDTSYST